MLYSSRIVISNVLLNNNSWTLPKNEDRQKMPTSGNLKLHVSQNEENCPEYHLNQAKFNRIRNLIKKSFTLDDHKMMVMIKILADSFCVTVDQANELLDLFDSPTCQAEKASAASALIPQISNSLHHTSHSELGSAVPLSSVFFEDIDGDGKIDMCGDITVLVGLKNLSQVFFYLLFILSLKCNF